MDAAARVGAVSFYPFAFEGVIGRYAFDRYAYTVVYLPHDLAKRLPFEVHPRLRIVGEAADRPVQGTWQPAGDGRRYFILSKKFLGEAGLAVGDPIEMRFALADQDAVDVPDALEAALSEDVAFALAWKSLTPGAQRAFAHRVAAAKTEATILRRVAEVREMVLAGERPGAPAAKRRKRSSRPGPAASGD